MKITGNTIFITGGGSGIGRGLAEALLKEGNKIIISGRREEMLQKTIEDNPGMEYIVLDITDKFSIESVSKQLIKNYPNLNILINNAGIMRAENIKELNYLEDSEEIITTNLLGPIRMTASLLSHLQKQKEATIINVSSGLAFVPLVFTPTYSATKAAIHSYTQSLRSQLSLTNIKVIEIVPPAVQTDLMDTPNRSRAMPLEDFINETITILKNEPDIKETLVERVTLLRFAESTSKFDETFKMVNNL